jgi:arylsulfatase A-like enzyme
MQSIDNHIQRLFDVLIDKNLFHNTIIMYTSDIGFQLGQHRLDTDKRHLYVHNIRVPFIIFKNHFHRNKYNCVDDINRIPIHQLLEG